MKILMIWTLLIAAVLPLTACHWRHHRYHHHFANGYSAIAHAQSHGDAKNDSRGS